MGPKLFGASVSGQRPGDDRVRQLCRKQRDHCYDDGHIPDGDAGGWLPQYEVVAAAIEDDPVTW